MYIPLMVSYTNAVSTRYNGNDGEMVEGTKNARFYSGTYLLDGGVLDVGFQVRAVPDFCGGNIFNSPYSYYKRDLDRCQYGVDLTGERVSKCTPDEIEKDLLDVTKAFEDWCTETGCNSPETYGFWIIGCHLLSRMLNWDKAQVIGAGQVDDGYSEMEQFAETWRKYVRKSATTRGERAGDETVPKSDTCLPAIWEGGWDCTVGLQKTEEFMNTSSAHIVRWFIFSITSSNFYSFETEYDDEEALRDYYGNGELRVSLKQDYTGTGLSAKEELNYLNRVAYKYINRSVWRNG